MEKTFLVIIMVVFAVLPSTAGGLLTNSSQSAQYVRMLSRNASAQTDAVYYNPAGLTRLADGWHFALNNESFLQNKTVNCGFPLLNNSEYNGKITTIVLPSVFAILKTGDWAFSLSFGLNANGGPGNFERGLPSFEIPISKVVPDLSDLSKQNYDVTNYDAKISFEGSSVFRGIQIGATYQINDLFSVYSGARYQHSSNNYRGLIRDVRLKVNGVYQKASVFLSFVGNTMKTTALSLSKTAGDLQSFITIGAGNLTLNQLQAANYIDIEKKEAWIKGLVDLGIITADGNMSVSQVQSAYDREAIQMNTRGNILNSKATSLKDKEINTRQTGSGFTPVLGINFSPSENLNLTARYEYKTSLKLKNDTNGDDLGVFPDGVKNNNDIPALLAAGIGYQYDRKIEAQFSCNLFFDREVNWGYNFRDKTVWGNIDKNKIRRRIINRNSFELALGIQFNLSDSFAFSAGCMTMQPGVSGSYQSDFSYSNPSVTVAGGFQWKLNKQLTLDAGVMNTFDKDVAITFNDSDVSTGEYSDTFGKASLGFALGISYSIF